MLGSEGLDNPKSDPKADAFNRWPFSKRIADTIAGFDSRDGAPVIGIFGRWGYGKSTVLNYIKRELEESYGNEILILDFNPWLFKTSDELITAFFTELANKLNQSLGTAAQEIGRLLQKGSGAFGLIPGVGSGLSKLTEQLGKELSADSLEN
jgi:predicted KAP-like P-loop ATPase